MFKFVNEDTIVTSFSFYKRLKDVFQGAKILLSCEFEIVSFFYEGGDASNLGEDMLYFSDWCNEHCRDMDFDGLRAYIDEVKESGGHVFYGMSIFNINKDCFHITEKYPNVRDAPKCGSTTPMQRFKFLIEEEYGKTMNRKEEKVISEMHRKSEECDKFIRNMKDFEAFGFTFKKVAIFAISDYHGTAVNIFYKSHNLPLCSFLAYDDNTKYAAELYVGRDVRRCQTYNDVADALFEKLKENKLI